MGFIIVAIKVLASIFMIAFLIAGIFKANPRTHRYRPSAEYLAGFIICVSATMGLYYLWK